MTITLLSPNANRTGSGEETATFMARPADGSWNGFYAAGAREANTAPPPRDNWTMTVDDAEPGTWDIWVWPHGAVTDQTYNLTVTARGTGELPTDATLGLEGTCGGPSGSVAPYAQPTR